MVVACSTDPQGRACGTVISTVGGPTVWQLTGHCCPMINISGVSPRDELLGHPSVTMPGSNVMAVHSRIELKAHFILACV